MKNMCRLFNNASGIKRPRSFKSLVFMILCIMGVNISQAQVNGDFQTKSAGGNWSDFNSWNIRSGGSWVAATAGQVPTSTSSVFIQSGHTISVDAATAVCNDLNATGSLTSKVAFSNATSVLNVKGNFTLFSTSHAVFGTWTTGAKLVFSGSGNQTITSQNANYTYLNLEINKPSGIFTTTSGNLKYDVITLTAGTFNVASGQEIRGLSSSSTVTVNGGTWTQTGSNTRINGGAGPDIALTINSGTMTLATTSGAAAGFNFSSVSISNGGILNLNNNFVGNINITNSLTIDATSKLNTTLTTTPIPSTHTLSGLVNYNHTGVQNIAAATYSNLRLSGTSLKTLAAGTTSIAANGILEMSGVATSPTLALGAGTLSVSATNTTLIYSSTGTQTATATEWSTNFQNLTINNGSVSGVSMAGLNRTINGTVTLTAGILNIGTSGTLILNGAALTRTAGFMDGTSTSDFTVTGTTGGTVNLPTNTNISLRNITISGTRTLAMNGTHNINLYGAFSIASGATFDTGGESQLIDNGGTVTIDGRFLTRDVEGFTGANTSIPGIVPTLNSGCTIEYGLAGNQAISIRSDYYNLDFTNSGTKSPVTASSITGIAGTVSIKDAAIVDVSNNSFGNGSTPLTMTGTSRFINGGSGVKPDMGGTYTLGSGTTIEFSLGSVTEIRLAPNYYHVVVSGTNVTLSSASSSVKFQSGGSFTVKNNGIFKVINTNGFSGSTNTAIDNTNSPSIILESGSTIEYSGANQTITNQTISTPSNANYEGLTLSGTGTKTAPATTLTVKGNLTKSGTSTFANNNGTVVLNGSAAQAYTAAAPVMDFYDLTINNIVDLTINNDLTVKRILAFGANAKLNFGSGNITLRSDASNTANVGQVPATAVIAYGGSGRFIVERYIPTGISHAKSWQFLSAPTVGQTIKESWMENGLVTSTPNGYGTWITGPGGTGAGFDAGSSTPSIKTYVPASDSWTATGNPATTLINNSRGYMLFVRGDRSVYNLSGANSAAVVTTLRTKGTLITGDQSPIPVTAGQFESIGNPYASAIDLTQLILNESGGGVQDIFYVWDPLLTTIGVNSAYGLGGFQTFTRNGASYDVTPGGGSYAATNKYIQSGQAFFAHAISTDGTVKLTESCKVGGSNIVTRPGDNNTGKQLRTNLYVMKNGVAVLIDGNLVQFDGSYSNTVDILDAVKLNNTAENLGLSRNTKTLAVERRQTIQASDTLFYKTGQLRIQSYRFEFIPSNIARPGLQAFLDDNYLGTKTPVSLNDTGRVGFTVNNDPRSYAADRFRLVFRQKRKMEDHIIAETVQSNNNISVYPNPVVDNTIRMVFNDQPGGKYRIQLSSQSGQIVLEQTMTIPANNYTRSLQVPGIVAGNYQLAITAANGNKTILHLIIR